MDNINEIKETSLKVAPVLPYLGSIFLQTRKKAKKSLKTSLIFANCK